MMTFNVCLELRATPVPEIDRRNNDPHVSYKMVTLIIPNSWAIHRLWGNLLLNDFSIITTRPPYKISSENLAIFYS